MATRCVALAANPKNTDALLAAGASWRDLGRSLAGGALASLLVFGAVLPLRGIADKTYHGIIDGTSSIQKSGDSELQIQSSEGRLLLRH